MCVYYQGIDAGTFSHPFPPFSPQSLDPFDPARPALVSQIQKEGNVWVAKYAPGGAAGTPSCKKLYIALSALLGHVAASGLAPLPSEWEGGGGGKGGLRDMAGGARVAYDRYVISAVMPPALPLPPMQRGSWGS